MEVISALGETGILGLLSDNFLPIILEITLKRLVPSIHSPFERALFWYCRGCWAGSAALIDIFEASKGSRKFMDHGVLAREYSCYETKLYKNDIIKVLTSNTSIYIYILPVFS